MGAFGAFAMLAVAACGGSAPEGAVVLIEEKFADEIGIGELDATCTEPDGAEEGDTFSCTATTEDDRTIDFVATKSEDDDYQVGSTNLLLESDVVLLREEGARALTESIGQPIEPADIVCPDGVIILDGSGDFVCEITDTTTGDVFELLISTGGLEPAGPPKDLYFEVGEQLS